jgi:hypothetical protein
MYQQTENQMILHGDFFLPFGGKLSEDHLACVRRTTMQARD